MKREKWIKVRVSDDEKLEINAKAKLASCTVADLIRQSLCRVRTWTVKDKKIEQDKIREIRRIGNNLNQIAKWCNQYKNDADSLQVLIQLKAIENNTNILINNSLSPTAPSLDLDGKE